MKVYRAKRGSRLNDEQAQVYGLCIEELEMKKGVVRAVDVVDTARKTSSPLHAFFDWDDEEAADKYRLTQAGYLLRSIEVIIQVEGGDQMQQRAYLNVIDEDADIGRVYVNVKKALTQDNYRDQIIRNAIRELEYWQCKYREYREFKKIFQAFKQVRGVLKK